MKKVFKPERIRDFIAVELIARRERLGWMQHELAKQLDISPGTMSKREAGLIEIEIEVFVRWAHVLDSDPDKVLRDALRAYVKAGGSK